MANPVTLSDWLEYIERQHPQSIAMGLDRVNVVRDTLQLKPAFPLITVGGTNGKGSACRFLESILTHAGYRAGVYTSPHLVHFNERVRIAGRDADDADLVRAFAAVERARVATGVALTYFEFGTLAAVWLFVERKVAKPSVPRRRRYFVQDVRQSAPIPNRRLRCCNMPRPSVLNCC